MYKLKSGREISYEDVNEILYLAFKDYPWRTHKRLILNLYRINNEQLVEIINNNSGSPVFVDNSISDYS